MCWTGRRGAQDLRDFCLTAAEFSPFVLPVGFDPVDHPVPFPTLFILSFSDAILSVWPLFLKISCPLSSVSVASPLQVYPALSQKPREQVEKAGVGDSDGSGLVLWMNDLPVVWQGSLTSLLCATGFCPCVQSVMMLLELVYHLCIWDIV